MSDHTITPESSFGEGQGKDNDLGKLKPKFKIPNEDFINEIAANNNGGNVFPIEVFPSLFKDLINDCQKALNFPPDYTGLAVLSAISTIIGTSAKVQVKKGWYEFAGLYASIIGNAGSNKTHPVTLAFKKLAEIDRKNIEKHKILYNEYEEYTELNPTDKKATAKVEKPTLIKSILHDFTPESLYQRLSENTRGCTVCSDELATFFEGMNQYSKGDQTSKYLSFWNNIPTTIDRAGKSLSMYIKQPYLGIIGGLQIRILTKIFTSNKTNNGLLQRFLHAFPDNTEKYPINDNEINENILLKYDEFIVNYLEQNPIVFNAETGNQDTKLYYWSDEAKSYFYEWQRLNTLEVNKNPDTLKGETISKFDNHFVRLALILQIMENSSSCQIGLTAVKGANELCKYFLHCAFKVLSILEQPKIEKETFPLIKRKFYDALPLQFTTSEANAIGETLELDVKAVQRFITDLELFIKLSHGKYLKK